MLHNDNRDQPTKARAKELFNLGNHYHLQKQYAEAILHHEEAIALGSADAMYSRARIHYKGKGEKDGKPNHAKAIELFEKAIALNYASAMNDRAYMYWMGYGEKDGKPNYTKAIELYEQAIALNIAEAMYGRALMHYEGHGEKDGKPNYTKALPLFLNALSKSKNLECITHTEDCISIIIEKHLGALAVNLIFQLLNTEQLTRVVSDRIKHFKHRKLDLVAYFRTLPEPEQFEAVKKALDQSHPLGKLFALPEGIIGSFFGATSDPLEEGTLLNEVYKLFTQLDEKRKQAASPSSTNIIGSSLSSSTLLSVSSLLEPMYINKKDRHNPELVSALYESLELTPSAIHSFMLTNEMNAMPYAAAPLSLPRERIAFQPFFFTNEMNHLPSVANLPPLPASRSTSETETQQRGTAQLLPF